MRQDDLEAIAEAVAQKLAGSGVEVSLRFPDGGSFVTLLPGIPRAGEVVWHPRRRNSKPTKFLVERVEWWNKWPNQKVEIFLSMDQVQPAAPKASS